MTTTRTPTGSTAPARPIRASRWVLAPFVAGLTGAAWLVVETASGRAPAWWAIASVAIVFLGAIALGLFTQAGLFARPIVGADAGQAGDRLALTFDDGPDAEATRAVLDLLDARGQRGTFFVIGRRVAEARALVEEIVRRGHAVANHSFSHAHALPAWSPSKIARDLTHAEALLDEVRGAAGAAPSVRRWLRAPVGIVSPPVAEAARLAGLELVGWSATARDGVARTSVATAHARLRAALAPGAILVLHDGAERGDRRPIAPAVLAKILDDMAARGLRSVTLDELFGVDTK